MKEYINTRCVHSLKPLDKPYEVVDTEVKGFLVRVQTSGVMTYYLSYRNQQGKRKRYCIGKHGTITTNKARDIAKQKAGDVASGIDVQLAKQEEIKKAQAEASKLTLKEFVDRQYHDWALTHLRNPNKRLKEMQTCFYQEFANMKLEAIDPFSIERWRSKRIKSGVTASTVNRNITELRSIFSKAKQWGVINNSPFEHIKPLRQDNNAKIRYLSKSEQTQLLEALDKREHKMRAERANANQWRAERGYELLPNLFDLAFVDYLKPMVLLAMHTGMRRGEIFNLEWQDINFLSKTVTINGNKAKSGQTRHIPLNKIIIEVMEDWKKQNQTSGLVFPNAQGYSLDNIATSWANLLELANIKDFRFHDLRHHFASMLVMSGVDLNTVRELLGHNDIKTTLRYAHLAPEHKQEAVEKLVWV